MSSTTGDETYLPSPVPSDSDLWPGEKPFTAFGQFGIDHIDLRVFDQDIYWVDRFGQPHLLDDMDDDYKRNVITYLDERAVNFHLATCMRLAIQAVGDAMLGKVSGEILACDLGAPSLAAVDAHTWLASTPLMRRFCQITPPA